MALCAMVEKGMYRPMRLKGQKTGGSIRIIDMPVELSAGVCHTLLFPCMLHARAEKSKEAHREICVMAGLQCKPLSIQLGLPDKLCSVHIIWG